MKKTILTGLLSALTFCAMAQQGAQKQNNKSNNTTITMEKKFKLPALDYNLGDLEPVISAQTMDLHYNKHFKAYIDNLNKLIEDTRFENLELEQIVCEAEPGGLFNNAGQVLNHNMFFDLLTPKQTIVQPEGKLAEAIDKSFGSFEEMKQKFSTAAATHFGSGWVFLVVDGDKLDIVSLANAGNPVRDGKTPLLALDVWEHAYYLDYNNRRAEYINGFWDIIDWVKVKKSYENL